MGDDARGANRAIEATKIVAMCIIASIVFGVVHDQFTARAYLPYFTEWPPHANMINKPTIGTYLYRSA